MAYLSSSTRARILSQIEVKETQLEAANAAYTESLTDANVQSYKFESGDGSQSSVRRRPAEILSQIRQLEQQIERLYRRLDGTGVVSLNLRRNY